MFLGERDHCCDGPGGVFEHGAKVVDRRGAHDAAITSDLSEEEKDWKSSYGLGLIVCVIKCE